MLPDVGNVTQEQFDVSFIAKWKQNKESMLQDVHALLVPLIHQSCDDVTGVVFAAYFSGYVFLIEVDLAIRLTCVYCAVLIKNVIT